MRINRFLAPTLALSAISGSSPTVVNSTMETCPAHNTLPVFALEFLSNSCLNPEYTPTNLSARADSISWEETVAIAGAVGLTAGLALRKKLLLIEAVGVTLALASEWEDKATLAVALALVIGGGIGIAVGEAVEPLERIQRLAGSQISLCNRILAQGTRKAGDFDTDKDCPICWETFEPGQLLFSHTTDNGVEHRFHNPCMEGYFKAASQSGASYNCPTCSMNLQL